MKIAVTGASGFIGRHVLAELARRPLEVVAVTRCADRMPKVAPSVRVVEIDLACPPSDAFQRLGCPDILIHLAWDGLPNYRALHHFETELPRQYGWLKLLLESGLKNLLVTGTCFEYGMQSGALSETLAAQPDNPYGYAKDALRRQLQYLQAIEPFNLTWARLFYLFGEGQAATSLLPKLRAAAMRGDRVFPMSGGEQLRDYLPVSEVARLIVELALAQTDYGIVNVCSGTPVSVRRLAERWVAEQGWSIGLELGAFPYPDYEPMAFWGDAGRLHRLVRVA